MSTTATTTATGPAAATTVRDAFCAGVGAIQDTPGWTTADVEQAHGLFRLWSLDRFAGTIVYAEARDALDAALGDHTADVTVEFDFDLGAVRWRHDNWRRPGWHEIPMAFGLNRVVAAITSTTSTL